MTDEQVSRIVAAGDALLAFEQAHHVPGAWTEWDRLLNEWILATEKVRR